MLDRHADVFADRNLFLQSVLGALSLTRRLDAALLPTVSAAADIPTDAAALTPTREAVLLALLGAVSLRHTLVRNIAELTRQPPGAASPTPPPTPELRRLLR